MQELTKTLSDTPPDLEMLAKVARTWAVFAMDTYAGSSLRRALDVTAAIIDFVEEAQGGARG